MHRSSILASSLALLLAVLVASGCGRFGEVYTGESGAKGDGNTTADITDAEFTAAARKKDGCDEIEEMEDRGSEHVEEDVDYEDNPPSSGSHSPSPLDWGVYDEPQQEERWVHSLEHGHIVVVYKGLSKAEYRDLKKARDKSPYHITLIPRPSNPKDGVYYVAWTARLYCEKPSRPGLQEMRERYLDQAPELITSDPEKPEED